MKIKVEIKIEQKNNRDGQILRYLQTIKTDSRTNRKPGQTYYNKEIESVIKFPLKKNP